MLSLSRVDWALKIDTARSWKGIGRMGFINEGTQIKEDQIAYEFKWIGKGSKNGKVDDQIGIEYIWSGTQKDGAFGYRCSNLFGRKSRCCTAVAHRFIKSNENGT